MYLCLFVCFQSSFTENHDVNVYNILISSCLIVALSRLELGVNVVNILQRYKQSVVEICKSYYMAWTTNHSQRALAGFGGLSTWL